MKKLLLIGGGGHCRSVLDSVLSLGLYDDVGIVDQDGFASLGISVIGRDDDLPRLKEEGWTDAFVSVGSIGNTTLRRRLYFLIKQYGFTVPTIIDPTSTIAKDCQFREGVFIGKHVVVNAGASIGTCCIINTGAIIEHDCSIGEFSHISPGAILCGQVTIGKDTHIGAGTVIRQQISVGDQVMIGAGSVVVKNVVDNTKAYGNPCKVVE